MKWFGVDSDTPNDPKIRALLLQGGKRSNLHAQARMGALFLVWCHIADHGCEPGRSIDARGEPLSLQEIADAAYFETVEELRKLMDFCALRKHIDPDAWSQRGEIFFPAMARRADEYSRKKMAGKIDARPFGKSGMSRRQIFDRDNWICYWCKEDLRDRASEAEVDHLVPRSQNGSDDPANLATSCRSCNRSRRLQAPPWYVKTAQAASASDVWTPQAEAAPPQQPCPDSPVCTVGSVDHGVSLPDHPDLRGVHTPRAREAAPTVLTGSLQRDHLKCFGPCVRVCYPLALAKEHARALGGDESTALERLARFRGGVTASLPADQAIGDKPFDFWRAHFAAAFPSAAPSARRPSAPSHTPADVDKYAHTAPRELSDAE